MKKIYLILIALLGIIAVHAQSTSTIFVADTIAIGTTTPKEELSVNGNIRAKDIKVDAVNWPDYVFTPAHILPSLELLRLQIKEQGHLPNIPSAEEASKNGIALGEMNKKLLEKVEELTLYVIKQNDESKQQSELIKKQSDLLEKQNKRIAQLEQLVSQPKAAQTK